MVRSCSAYNCSNRNLPGGTLAFHQFPLQDSARLKKWLKNMRREHFYPSRTTYLCSEHFEEKCYWKGHKKKLLNDNAVPTIFNFSEHHFKKIRRKKFKKILKPKIKKLKPEMVQKNTLDKIIDLDEALEKPSTKKYKNKQGQAVDGNKKSIVKRRTDSHSDKRKSKRIVKVLKTDIDSDDQIFEQCLINEDNGDIFILSDMNDTVDGISTFSESCENVEVVKNEYERKFQSLNKKCVKNDQSVKKKCVEKCGHKNNDSYCETIGPSVINKYAKGDHTYVKHFSDHMEEMNAFLRASDGAKISPEHIFEAMGESGIPDANVLEAIHEMGKSNAVILLVKEELLNPSQAVICKKRTKSDALQDVYPSELMDTVEIGEIQDDILQVNDEIIKQIHAHTHDKCPSTVCKITPKKTNTEPFKVKEEFRKIDARMPEADQSVFRPKDIKEKCGADIIKKMQMDHLKLTNEMIHVVNTQRKEIDNLKMLLNTERMNTKILCSIEDVEFKPKTQEIHNFGILLHSISPEAYEFVKQHTNLDLPDVTLIEPYSKLVENYEAHLETDFNMKINR